MMSFTKMILRGVTFLCLATSALAATIPVDAAQNITANKLEARGAGKRLLLWDWTNTKYNPQVLDKIPFNGPFRSLSNWNAWYPTELKHRAPFRPMVRTMAETSGQDWQNILNTNEPIVQFFNEPDLNGISVEDAVRIWRNQMLPLRRNKGKKLVSPACIGNAVGIAWLDNFMKALGPNEKPDYTGVHYYGTDAKEAQRHITDVYNRNGQRPVIVSEVASLSRDYNQVVKFTVDLANWMDSTPWVFEYGFFGCMKQVPDGFVSPAAQLMKQVGSFTPLMAKLMTVQPMHY